MKKLSLLVFLLLLIVNTFGQAMDDSLKAGNQYYTEEKYEDAIRVYEWILNEGFEAPELYYNLGNAYFKSHKMTFALLNYERAKLLDPVNEDIDYNLELAKSFAIDKIDEVPPFFLTQWHNAMVNMFSGDAWAVISMASFVFLLLVFSIYLYTRKYGIKKLSFWISVLLLYISISSFVFALNDRQRVLHPGTALILSSSVTVESSPDESGTDLFLIHEGTKVTIKEKLGDWTRIRLSDGKTGWVPSNSIIEI
jgi:tetratricopeptide (TPR) repeat protein